jgi:uncharacterized membrane protein YgdD (TMEM256/DUF423 family)
MSKATLIRCAALSAAIAIAAGAFGAHLATGKAVLWLQTGASYGLIHAVAVIALARWPSYERACWMLLGGSILFALTLYLMAVGLPLWLGAITPIGGGLMIVGWLWVGLTRFAVEERDNV